MRSFKTIAAAVVATLTVGVATATPGWALTTSGSMTVSAVVMNECSVGGSAAGVVCNSDAPYHVEDARQPSFGYQVAASAYAAPGTVLTIVY